MTYNYSFMYYQDAGFAFGHMGRDLMSDGHGGTSPAIVDTGHWQALTDVPHTQSIEMRNVLIEYPIPQDVRTLETQLLPNLPWAEEEFQNRVEGVPHNPHPSVVNWPWYDASWEASKGGQYSHTYAERYWPKQAGDVHSTYSHKGIRYYYGDLNDVVSLLAKHSGTRQAYLPVWFPEDTGAVHGERVPCSLGYHWLLRDGKLHCNYFIRSCDFLRYLRDDMYLTCRLTQWVANQLNREEYDHLPDPVVPGDLTMFIGSLHVFEGDLPKMRRLYA